MKPFIVGGLLLSSLLSLGAEDAVQHIMQTESIRQGERRAQAETFYETGLLLYRQQQYEKAAEYFQKALSLNPDDQDSKNYLIRVQSVLGVKSAVVSSESEWLEQNIQVRRQEQWAQQRQGMEVAENAYASLLKAEGLNTAEKLNRVLDVRALYEKNGDIVKTIDPSEEQRRAKAVISDRIAVLAEMEVKLRSEVESEMRVTSRQQMIREREDDSTYLKNRINSVLEAANAELGRENFDSCLELCDDILTVEPENKEAITLRRKALAARHKRVELTTTFDREKELSQRLLKIKESFVPYSSSVVYPSDWDKVEKRQMSQFGKKDDPSWKRKLEGSLDRYVSYSCPGLPLTEVLAQLSELSGLNIVLSPKVLQERNEDSLELREFGYNHMKLRYILKWVCREVDLDYVLKYDVIYVTSRNIAIDKAQIRIYDVQDLLSSKPNFAAPQLEDGSATGDSDIAIQAEDINVAEPISGDVLVEMIQRSIAGAWEEDGILLKPLETGALLIKNTPQVHEQVLELLQTLRKTSSLQIEVEARSLTISKGFFREVGIDWSGLNTVDPLNVGTEVGFFDRSNDKYAVKGAILNGLASQIPGVGFFLEHSILGSFQAKVLLKALEQDTDSTQLIAPRLVLVNNVLGYIRLGRTQNYISGYESGTSTNNGSAGLQPTIVSADDGQLLAVTATISSDRKYITLRLHPDFQQVTIPRVVAIVGTQSVTSVLGTTTATYNLPIDMPSVTKRKVRTTAVIPDDGVLILGGVATSSEARNDRGVPVLSKIPVIGRLFRSDNKTDNSADSMLLVHGKIIVFDELEAGL